MKSSVKHVYILTMAEFTVIAAAKNIQGLFSMQSNEGVVDETAVCHALNHLYQKEFIHNAEKEGFVLEDGLSALVTAIEEAKAIVVLRHLVENACIKVIYVGSRIVATEQRTHDMEHIRIYEISPEEVGDYIQNEDVEERVFHSVLDEERILLEGIQKKHILQNEEIQAMGNVVTVVEKMSANGKKVNRRMIEKQDDKFFCYSREKTQVENLSKQEFYNAIEMIIKEELYDIG